LSYVSAPYSRVCASLEP